MKKLQTQILSLIIMAGIVMGLVGVAYIWGAPMIEKRTVYTQYTSAEKFVTDLNRKITDLASTCTTAGGCTHTMNIPEIESSSIVFDNTENTIYYQFPAAQKMLTEDEVAINTPYIDDIADYGTAPPGIIRAGGTMDGNTYIIRFSIKYRELEDKESGVSYRIDINGANSGKDKIIMTYGGTTNEIDPFDGSEITISNIELKVI